MFLLLSLISSQLLFTQQPAKAVAGINEQLNYQARLLTSTGAVVADGTYNVEFKIYQDGTGCVSSGSSPCGGTLKWTETRTTTNRITVKNGYFSVQLGSVTPFGTSVDWNQDTLWLSINIGGTAVSPVWDGEMTPFRRLSATPYALNAGKLGGLDASKFVQIAPSAVQIDSGTLDSLFLNKTGASGNILRLQKSGADVFIMDNTGKVALGSVSPTQKFEVQGGDAAIYNSGNNARLILGDSGVTGQYGYLQWDSANDYFRIEKNGTNGVKINDNFVSIGNLVPDSPLKVGNGNTLLMSVGTTGQFVSKTSTDSVTGFRVADATDGTVLNVDTLNNRVGINGIDAPATSLDVSGAIQQTGIDTSDTGAADNNKWTKLGSCTLTAQYQQCLTTLNILAGYDGDLNHNIQATVNARVKQQAAMGGAPIVNLQLNGVAEYITASDLKAVTTVNTGTTTTVELWGRIANIFDHWSYTPVMNTGRYGSATWVWSPQNGFSVALPAGTQTAAGYGNMFTAGLQATGTISLTSDNAINVKSSTNSTTAFQVLNSTNIPQLNVDTTNSRVYLGPTAGNTVGTTLVFGKKTDAGDPAGVDGAMYYSASRGTMRCFVDSAWSNCSNPTRLTHGYNIQEDFIGSSTGGKSFTCGGANTNASHSWACSVVNGAPSVATVEADSAQRPGQAQLRSGTNIAGLASLYLSNGTTPAFFIGGGESFETAINIPILSNATERYIFRAGICDVLASHATDCSNGVYFEYDSATSVNWRYATAAAAARTKVSSTKIAAVGWTNLKFVANSNASISFYVKNAGDTVYTLIGTTTTTIPSTNTNIGALMFYLDKQAGTTNRNVTVDYVDYWNDLTTTR